MIIKEKQPEVKIIDGEFRVIIDSEELKNIIWNHLVETKKVPGYLTLITDKFLDFFDHKTTLKEHRDKDFIEKGVGFYVRYQNSDENTQK